MKITDETIMPDGRPFFAWKNELKMLRNQEGFYVEAMKQFKQKMSLLRIAEIESHEDIPTGDIVVRFKRIDFVKDLNPDLTKIYHRESQNGGSTK